MIFRPERLIRVPITMDLCWRYPAGESFSRFFTELKESGKILAIRCGKCKRIWLPPRPLCGDCFERMDDWIAVGPAGTVRASTICHYEILNSETGKPRPIPFGLALIQLDGADTTLNHYIADSDLDKLRIGVRVRVVLKDRRQGNIQDILYFEIAEEA